jgi:hypothetical protein
MTFKSILINGLKLYNVIKMLSYIKLIIKHYASVLGGGAW